MLNILGRSISEAVFKRLAGQGPQVDIPADQLIYATFRKQIFRHEEMIVVASGEKYEVIAQPEVVGDEVPKLTGTVKARILSKQLLKKLEALSTPGAREATPTHQPYIPRDDRRPDTRFDGRRDERPVYQDRDAPRPTLADAFQRSTVRRSS